VQDPLEHGDRPSSQPRVGETNDASTATNPASGTVVAGADEPAAGADDDGVWAAEVVAGADDTVADATGEDATWLGDGVGAAVVTPAGCDVAGSTGRAGPSFRSPS
jgi:hypothetical protein